MKKIGKLITMMLLAVLVLAGCGAEKVPAETTDVTAKTPEAQTETAGDGDDAEETEALPEAEESGSEGQATDFVYLEEYQIKDVFGDGGEYAVYAPKGGQIMEEWFYTVDSHGVEFSASVFPGGTLENLEKKLKDDVSLTAEVWQEDSDCSDVSVGEMAQNGDDRYLFATTKDTDYNGMTYQRTELHYVSVRDGGIGVFWELEVCENDQDEETAAVLEEIARCYGLDLSAFAMEDGTWTEQETQRKEQVTQSKVDRQDVYEPEEGDPVLEKAEGYQFLGSMTIVFDEEQDITSQVLAPMGWNTQTWGNRVSTTIHGVSVRTGADYTYQDFQETAQKMADEDFESCSDPEKGNRNVRISEVMSTPAQESGFYYVLEYEEKDYASEEYYKRADITSLTHVQDKYFINCKVSLESKDYDYKTNSLIKELETAYGLDLSAWYAEE